MAKHVFVDGSANAATYTFGTNAAFNGNAVGLIGIWSLDLADHINGGSGEELLKGSMAAGTATIIPNKFQITQNTTADRPYASPIIDREKVKKITYSRFLTSAKATTGSVTATTYQAGKTHSIKIVKLTGYDNYEEFLNPTGSYDDRISQVRNYSVDHVTNTADTIQAFVDAINNDAGAFVVATKDSGTQMTIAAKDLGTAFKVIDVSVELDATNGLAVAAGSLGTFAYTAGVGDGHKAVEAEKRSRGHVTGSHNRIWFQNTPEMFASAAKDYHIIAIECDGGVRQDATNAKDDLTIELWIPSLADDANGACKVDETIEGYDLTGGVSAGDTIVLYDRA